MLLRRTPVQLCPLKQLIKHRLRLISSFPCCKKQGMTVLKPEVIKLLFCLLYRPSRQNTVIPGFPKIKESLGTTKQVAAGGGLPRTVEVINFTIRSPPEKNSSRIVAAAMIPVQPLATSNNSWLKCTSPLTIGQRCGSLGKECASSVGREEGVRCHMTEGWFLMLDVEMQQYCQRVNSSQMHALTIQKSYYKTLCNIESRHKASTIWFK